MPVKHLILVILISLTCVSIVGASIIGEDWLPVSANASWSPRYDHTALVFNDELWVLGGSGGNDVWKSGDGVSWNKVTDSAGWLPRSGHASVVFDNRMWVLGGISGTILKNEVWYSTDGVTWTEATKNAGWAPRSGHASLVYEGKIWVLGGGSGSGVKNDVWYSEDGSTWVQATGKANWSPRLGHTSLVYDGKMWVLGGESKSGLKNDVWYSTDGSSWTAATETAEWTYRSGHQSVVFGEKMWILGGYIGLRSMSGRQELSINDVWYSYDGKIWYPATMEAHWSPRYGHQAVVFHDRMWVLGGIEPGGPESAVFDLGPGEYVYSRLPDIIDNDVWESDSVIKSPTTTLVTPAHQREKATQSSPVSIITICSSLIVCIFLYYRRGNTR
jgi:hypothetical protein